MIHFEDYEYEARREVVYLQEEEIPEFAVIIAEGLNFNYELQEVETNKR